MIPKIKEYYILKWKTNFGDYHLLLYCISSIKYNPEAFCNPDVYIFKVIKKLEEDKSVYNTGDYIFLDNSKFCKLQKVRKDKLGILLL